MLETSRTFIAMLALGLFTAGCSERQSKAAETAAAAPAAPQAGGYEGFLDEVSCDVIRGWAWDPSRPNASVTIELHDGNRLLTSISADQLRPDLADGGKGNGKHMFRQTTPKEFKDGKPHSIRAVITGTTYELKPSEGVAATVTCAPSGT